MKEKDSHLKSQTPENLDQDCHVDYALDFPDRHFLETFEARARLSRINKFLLDHPAGQFLVVNGVFTHPVLIEKDRQAATYKRLISAYQNAHLLTEPDIAESVVVTDPDLLPSDAATVTIQESIKNRVVSAMDYQLSQNSFDQMGQINFKVGLYSEVNANHNESELTKQAAEAVQDISIIAEDLYYSTLRDKFLELAAQKKWGLIIDMLYNLQTIPELNKPLSRILEIMGAKLFANVAFRKSVTKFMIKQVTIENISGQESFSEFLLANGFPVITDAEKASFLSPEYQTKVLENLRYRNPQKYFDTISYLYSYGLITDDFLRQSPLFKLHIIEFTLKAFYGHGNLALVEKTIRPFAARVGLFQPEELSLSNQFSLYGTYQTLCHRLNLNVDQALRKLYQRPNHSSKWEE